ncbi:leucyl/phenylalanyl-tRNA--protein transferase [Polaromonas sp. A23]|uniref:leucyl/phenylalanyl-tRNA--protein transferase n=1 Tax=Polaromonas sp. A23 TaxID=1944133 RepID=UPI0009850F19|nr:leucyl/phenylalanyl-tRNA--protein transferase [Polaromonas sp. A23]OOG39945.1 leucyl/phenylalanyl-tRNA--protein transferase [Polaromonas sp. A23]
MRKSPHPLPWLDADEPFPPVEAAWAAGDPAPGLLAAGRSLGVSTLRQAYAMGIFPWFGAGQPILWWSPDPRMVLRTDHFRLHRSLRKTLLRFVAAPGHEIRFDTAFPQVIHACATTLRDGQPGTWIVPDMVKAYTALHCAGDAHSVETWIHGELVGGLYCVNLGGMVFGESMFARQTDASKIALAALVAFCRAKEMPMVDCQQNTGHLASFGATEMPRAEFVSAVATNMTQTAPRWEFDALYWNQILKAKTQNELTT